MCHGYGVHSLVRSARLLQRGSQNRNDIAQVLARGQFRHYSAVRLVRCELREHDVRDHLFARTNDGRTGFVAGTLNTQDVSISHISIVTSRRAIPSWQSPASPVLPGIVADTVASSS